MTTGYVPFPQLHFCLKTSSISVISGGSRASAWCRGVVAAQTWTVFYRFSEGQSGDDIKSYRDGCQCAPSFLQAPLVLNEELITVFPGHL